MQPDTPHKKGSSLPVQPSVVVVASPRKRKGKPCERPRRWLGVLSQAKDIGTYTGWVTGTWLLLFHLLGISSSQLTVIFFRGVETTNQVTLVGLCDFPREHSLIYHPFCCNFSICCVCGLLDAWLPMAQSHPVPFRPLQSTLLGPVERLQTCQAL